MQERTVANVGEKTQVVFRLDVVEIIQAGIIDAKSPQGFPGVGLEIEPVEVIGFERGDGAGRTKGAFVAEIDKQRFRRGEGEGKVVAFHIGVSIGIGHDFPFPFGFVKVDQKGVVLPKAGTAVGIDAVLVYQFIGLEVVAMELVGVAIDEAAVLPFPDVAEAAQHKEQSAIFFQGDSTWLIVLFIKDIDNTVLRHQDGTQGISRQVGGGIPYLIALGKAGLRQKKKAQEGCECPFVHVYTGLVPGRY